MSLLMTGLIRSASFKIASIVTPRPEPKAEPHVGPLAGGTVISSTCNKMRLHDTPTAAGPLLAVSWLFSAYNMQSLRT